VTQDELTDSHSKRSELSRWLIALLLSLPVLFPYISHFTYARAHGLIATGFLIRDMPYYMANAVAHFAGGHFHLFYALPFSPYDNSPAIYFQPHTLLLGLMWKITGFEIHTVFLIFSAVATLVCARVAIALYEQIVGFDTRGKKIALVLFFWGGGIIVLAGAIRLLLVGPGSGPMEFERLFDFDPFRGLWFLDFGRNLLLGTEAYYHALFFGAILLAMRGRFIGSAIVTLALSMSHPFTGLELLGVLTAWIGLERFLLRKRTPPNYYVISIGVILLLHVGYYLWFLPHASPEHAAVAKVWESRFVLSWQSLLAAYSLVFALAAYTVHTRARWHRYFSNATARLLAVWFVVALLLANHDLFVAPVQPLHFTRGYIWTPLFFIGAPTLVALLDALLRKRLVGLIAVSAISILFLLDNALWLTTFSWRYYVITDGVMITPDRWDILLELRKPQYKDALVLTSDANVTRDMPEVDLSYLVTAYVPLRSWYSHWANTPYRDQRADELLALFNRGVYLDEWRARKTVVILRNDQTPGTPAWLEQLHGRLTKQNGMFRVYLIEPSP
jgi:hypothetical protein